MATRLTDLGIRALPFQDGQKDFPDPSVPGLFLRVGRRTKSFMLTIRANGHRERTVLGHYPDLTLSRARELARDRLAHARIAPAETKQISITFGDALATFYDVHLVTLRPLTQQTCRWAFEKYLADLRPHRLADISTVDIAAILDGLAHVPGSRWHVFVYARVFFNWCYQRGLIDVSPMARLKPPEPSRPRERVLNVLELVRIWRAAPQTDYGLVIKLCLISGQRIGQWARWKPEYLADDVITWPAHAMKANRAHLLPTTPRIRELIHARAAHHPWRMPDSRAKARLDTRTGVTGWTHHDLRRTFSTICAEELQIPPHVTEAILAHAHGSVVSRTYNRATYLKPMLEALIAFDQYLTVLLNKL